VIETKKKILVLALAVVMLALPMSMVYAKNEKNDKFTAVSGTIYLFYDGTNEMKYPDNNFIWSQSDCTAMWIGGIMAGGTMDFTFIFIKPVWQLVGEEWTIVDSRNGVVQEVSTLTDPIIDGTQYYGELTIGGANDYWRVLGGTGDLANVHGQGTKLGTDPLTVEYEGWIHFGP
jgi:hypothetical protein